jgi:hypothetical protein
MRLFKRWQSALHAHQAEVTQLLANATPASPAQAKRRHAGRREARGTAPIYGPWARLFASARRRLEGACALLRRVDARLRWWVVKHCGVAWDTLAYGGAVALDEQALQDWRRRLYQAYEAMHAAVCLYASLSQSLDRRALPTPLPGKEAPTDALYSRVCDGFARLTSKAPQWLDRLALLSA